MRHHPAETINRNSAILAAKLARAGQTINRASFMLAALTYRRVYRAELAARGLAVGACVKLPDGMAYVIETV